MLTEKAMEDAISENPEKYLEAGLVLKERQHRVGDYMFDLLFEDRHGAKLIVELQKGTLDSNHTYKILDYYDEYKNRNPDHFVELMIIANRIPRERRDRLSSYGIAFKEIPESDFPDSDSKPENESNPQDESPVEHANDMNHLDWDMDALGQVESWLREYIKDYSVGETLKVGKVARRSRQVAHILPDGNVEGFRHLLGRLAAEGYVELTGKQYFRITKKPE